MAPPANNSPPPPPIVEAVPLFVGGSPFYVSGEDAIAINVFNAASGVIVRVAGRFLPRDSGHVRPFNFDVAPTTDRTANSRSNALAEGWLLDADVIVSTGSPLDGQTWVRVTVGRGLGSGAQELASLVSGYVTAQKRVTWPSSLPEGPLAGPGALRSITGTAPAAGANITETVPTGARWEVLAVTFALTTSVTVATRVATFIIDDGASNLAVQSPQSTQAASQTITYTAAPGLSGIFSQSDNRFAIQLPNTPILRAGWRVRTAVLNLQAGDQLTAPQLWVREWIEG